MTPEWWASLVPAIGVTCVAAFARHQQGSWLAPGAFFGLFWCALIWAAVIVNYDVTLWPAAIWWIGGGFVATYLGSVLGTSTARRIRLDKKPLAGNWPALAPLIVVCSLAGFAGVGVLLRSRGLGPQAIVSLDNLADVAREFSVARYQEGYQEPPLATLLLTGTYVAALLAGILLASETSRARRRLAILPIGSALAVTSVETTKATLLFAIVSMMASYLTTSLVGSSRSTRIVTWPRIYKLTIVFIVLGALLLPVQLSRYGYSASNGGQVDEVLTGQRVTAFGYLGTFSAWLNGYVGDQGPLTLGASSFPNVPPALGWTDRPIGVYAENVYLGSASVPSNVYTAFRGLIQDFGLTGSAVVLTAVGFISGWAYVRIVQGYRRYVPIMAAFYATILWSPVINIFTYNSLILAWLLLTGYVVITERATIGRRGNLTRTSLIGLP